jgi:hypothetical protein
LEQRRVFDSLVPTAANHCTVEKYTGRTLVQEDLEKLGNAEKLVAGLEGRDGSGSVGRHHETMITNGDVAFLVD